MIAVFVNGPSLLGLDPSCGTFHDCPFHIVVLLGIFVELFILVCRILCKDSLSFVLIEFAIVA